MTEKNVFDSLISVYRVEKRSAKNNNVFLAKKPTKIVGESKNPSKKEIKLGDKQIIQFNTWKKLFMLCKYNISSDFFEGRDICFSTLQTYKNFIRGVVEGRYKEDSKIVKNNQPLYKFTKMMLEKGVRPYESLNGKSVSVFKLLTDPKLTEADINFIKSPLSSTIELDVPESAIQPIQPSIPKPCQPIKPQAEVETSEEKQVEEKQINKVDDFKYCLVESDRIITLSDNLTFLEGYKKALQDTIEKDLEYKFARISFM